MASLPTSPLTPRTPSTPRTPGFNTKSPTIKRILQESRELSLSPDPSLTASPLETNLFEWHFTISGPPSTPYALGIYHGRIVLPPTYPLRPPSFRFLTPSGRFEVNREICLSISGHHEETWQPAWGIRTALCAIRAFMAGEAKGQIGGLDMKEEARKKLAKESRAWKCTGCGRSNQELIEECKAKWQEQHAGEEGDLADQRSEIQIPEELRLSYKDDMERGPPTPNIRSATDEPSELRRSGELGQVPARAGGVAGVLARPKPPPSPLRMTAAARELGRGIDTTRAPPATSNLRFGGEPSSALSSTTTPTALRITAPSQRLSETIVPQSAVPKWLDLAILGIIIGIVVMVARKLSV